MKHLSPTAIRLWRENKEEFFLKYISGIQLPKIPQNQAMAAGAAFDAYVKAEIIKCLFARVWDGFEIQVEPQNRDYGRQAGSELLDSYKRSGAFGDLMLDLRDAVGEPRFEFELRTQINGIDFFCKPDVYFVTRDGAHIILDFKVNGFVSGRGSPAPGYIKCRDGWDHALIKASKSHGSAHPSAQVMRVNGIMINGARMGISLDWDMQTTIYAWCVGEPIGGDFIVAIEQLVGNPTRCASHRARIARDFQLALWTEIKEIWEITNSDWVFRDLTKAESKEKCELLTKGWEIKDKNDEWFVKNRG